MLFRSTIDGRLSAAGHLPMSNFAQHAVAFARGYSFWSEQKQTETSASLWQNATPRHADFLALIADPRGLRDTQRPAPGASCPLCDFPTFTWANAAASSKAIQDRIRVEFPSWTPEQGMCGRCLETYIAATAAHLQPVG